MFKSTDLESNYIDVCPVSFEPKPQVGKQRKVHKYVERKNQFTVKPPQLGASTVEPAIPTKVLTIIPINTTNPADSCEEEEGARCHSRYVLSGGEQPF